MQGRVAIGSRGTRDPELDGYPEIGDDVWFRYGASAWGPIQIGRGTHIGAGATLTQSVPPGSVSSHPGPKWSSTHHWDGPSNERQEHADLIR